MKRLYIAFFVVSTFCLQAFSLERPPVPPLMVPGSGGVVEGALNHYQPQFGVPAPKADSYNGMSQDRWTVINGDQVAVMKLFMSVLTETLDDDFVYLASRRADLGIVGVLIGAVGSRAESMILWRDNYNRYNSLHLAAFANNIPLFKLLWGFISEEKQCGLKENNTLYDLECELRRKMYSKQGDYTDMLAHLKTLFES